MKIRSRFYLKDYEGQERVREKFLFIPRSFGEKHCKWLEWAPIVERVEKQKDGLAVETWRWTEVGFAPRETSQGLPRPQEA